MYMGVAGAKGESDAGASSPISIFGWSGRAKGGSTGRATGAATSTRGSLCFAFGSGTVDHRLSEQTKREETERQYIRLGGVRNPLCWATGASCIHAGGTLMPWPPSPAKPVDSADMLAACHTSHTRVNQYHTNGSGSP